MTLETLDCCDLTLEEIAKVNDLRVRFRVKRDLYYHSSADTEDRQRIYKEALDLLHERLYILLGV